MNKGTIIAILAIVFVFVEPKLKEFDWGGLVPSVGASVSIETADKPTSDKVLTAVAPVQKSLANADRSDKIALADLWKQMANLIEVDDSVITSTEAIYRANIAAGKLLHLGAKGKYGDLGKQATQAVKDVVGDDIVNLDSSKRALAVDVFNGLSWAALQ